MLQDEWTTDDCESMMYGLNSLCCCVFLNFFLEVPTQKAMESGWIFDVSRCIIL